AAAKVYLFRHFVSPLAHTPAADRLTVVDEETLVAKRGNHFLREGLHLILRDHRPYLHEDEMSYSSFPKAVDLVDTLLLVADDYAIARFFRRRLSHHRDQPGQHLLALLGRVVGHRERQRLFDLIGVATDRIGMTFNHPDEALHFGGVGIAHVPHVGILRDDFEQNSLAVPADHQLNIFLNRFRIADRIDDVVMLAFQRRFFLAEHPLDDLARLVERFEALRDSFEIEAEAFVLELEPSGAQPEVEATAA